MNFESEGVLPTADTFQGFGSPAMFPPTECGPVLAITTTGYQEFNGGKPVCGTLASTGAGG
jgi:hypothetical protein